jgi:hypothetical protein
MFADPCTAAPPISPVWTLAQSLIAGGAGLLGVLIGTIAATINAKRERKMERLKTQLQEFYSPMLGVRSEIKAKSEVRLKVTSIASGAFAEEFGTGQLSERIKPAKDVAAKYEAIHDYNNTQWRESLVPLYRQMLDHFTHHMHLAEHSTRVHYDALCEFVEIWNRSLDESLPSKVAQKLAHDEGTLQDFYSDLQFHFERLLKETSK